MKIRHGILLAILAFPVSLVACENIGSLSPQEIYERVSPSVFIVEYNRGQVFLEASSTGSAVAVSHDEVVTNKHIILEFPGMIRVKQGKSTWRAFVSHLDSANDICCLKVPGLKAKPVAIKSPKKVKVGDRVFAVGNPRGLETTLSEGLVSGLREHGETSMIQTTAAISPGSSGGGLFDNSGDLIGITTAYIEGGQNLNFAVPISAVATAVSLSQREGNQLMAQAIASLQAGDEEKAQNTVKRVLSTTSGLAEAWYLRYLAEKAAQDRKRAAGDDALHTSGEREAVLEEALKLNQSFCEALVALALTYFDAANKSSTLRADARFGKGSLESSRKATDPAFLLSEERKLLEQAKAFLQKAIKGSASSPALSAEYHTFYGNVCAILGDSDKELASRRTALISMEPNNLYLLGRLAGCYSRNGNQEEADKIRIRMLELTPKRALDYMMMVSVTFLSGSYDTIDQARESQATRQSYHELAKSFQAKERIQKEKDQAEAQLALEEMERQRQ